MSCGQPHETPCNEVLADVYLFLDSECDPVSKDKIRKHLEECGSCLQKYGIEQEVKALVARCCRQEVAPDQLRQRLKDSLRAVVTESVSQTVIRSDDTIITETRHELRYRGPNLG